MKKILHRIISILLLSFGLMTFYLSFSLIFDLFGVRSGQENFVTFVAWTNLGVSLGYILAAYGFFVKKAWTTYILAASIVFLLLTLIAYLVHITSGQPHLEKTLGALIFRVGVTIFFTFLAYLIILKQKRKH